MHPGAEGHERGPFRAAGDAGSYFHFGRRTEGNGAELDRVGRVLQWRGEAQAVALEELVAEFEPADSGRDAVLRADPAAVEVEQAQTVVRIRRVRAPSDTDEFARGASSASARLSPVLHEGPSPATPMGALPGGVVATFPKDWDLALVRAWVANLDGQMEPTAVEWWRVRMETEIAPATNMFLLTTPPGLESVRIANELHETGELVEVTPSSWLQAITH